MILYILTQNDSKFHEISLILAKYKIKLKQLKEKKLELQLDDVAEIALYAVKAACKPPFIPIAVDDTALYIEALGGFPGPYAEYVYRRIGVNGIIRLLEGVENRAAKFITAVAYCDGIEERVFQGVLEGSISRTPKGNLGFGFDPIFVPEGENKTLAEMTTEEKNRISHRGMAFRSMAEWLVTSGHLPSKKS